MYKDKDFSPEFNETILKAKNMWIESCKKNFEQFGDQGSCVCGAGIVIDYIAPRCRIAKDKMIISSRDVMQCQGSLNWERGQNEVVKFLNDNGIKASFRWGWLD